MAGQRRRGVEIIELIDVGAPLEWASPATIDHRPPPKQRTNWVWAGLAGASVIAAGIWISTIDAEADPGESAPTTTFSTSTAPPTSRPASTVPPDPQPVGKPGFVTNVAEGWQVSGLGAGSLSADESSLVQIWATPDASDVAGRWFEITSSSRPLDAAIPLTDTYRLITERGAEVTIARDAVSSEVVALVNQFDEWYRVRARGWSDADLVRLLNGARVVDGDLLFVDDWFLATHELRAVDVTVDEAAFGSTFREIMYAGPQLDDTIVVRTAEPPEAGVRAKVAPLLLGKEPLGLLHPRSYWGLSYVQLEGRSQLVTVFGTTGTGDAILAAQQVRPASDEEWIRLGRESQRQRPASGQPLVGMSRQAELLGEWTLVDTMVVGVLATSVDNDDTQFRFVPLGARPDVGPVIRSLAEPGVTRIVAAVPDIRPTTLRVTTATSVLETPLISDSILIGTAAALIELTEAAPFTAELLAGDGVVLFTLTVGQAV